MVRSFLPHLLRLLKHALQSSSGARQTPAASAPSSTTRTCPYLSFFVQEAHHLHRFFSGGKEKRTSPRFACINSLLTPSLQFTT